MDDNNLAAFDCELIHSGFYRVYESIERSPKDPIQRCIFTEPNHEIFSLKDSFKKNYGKDLLSHMEVSGWVVIVNLVISNVGVGFFPDYLAHVPYRKKLLRPSKIKYDPLPYDLFAVTPNGEDLSKNARLFLKCLKEEVASSFN